MFIPVFSANLFAGHVFLAARASWWDVCSPRLRELSKLRLKPVQILNPKILDISKFLRSKASELDGTDPEDGDQVALFEYWDFS